MIASYGSDYRTTVCWTSCYALGILCGSILSNLVGVSLRIRGCSFWYGLTIDNPSVIPSFRYFPSLSKLTIKVRLTQPILMRCGEFPPRRVYRSLLMTT